MAEFTVNGRFLHLEPGGFKTYATELASRLDVEVIKPGAFWSRGLRGRAWEQTVLPIRARGKTLISPAGSGPWFHQDHFCVVHDILPLQRPDLYSKLFVWATRIGLSCLTRHARGLIVPSVAVQDALVAHGIAGRQPILVASPGVGERFAPLAERADGRPPLVVGINSNVPRKGGSRTVAALAHLHLLTPEVRTVVFGHDGPDRVFGGRPRPTHGRVDDLGDVPDEIVAQLFREADVVVSLSVTEGFGMPQLEALASGAALVATDVPSLLGRWGPGCRYVSGSATTDELARLIVDVLDDGARPLPRDAQLPFPSWEATLAAISAFVGEA